MMSILFKSSAIWLFVNHMGLLKHSMLNNSCESSDRYVTIWYDMSNIDPGDPRWPTVTLPPQLWQKRTCRVECSSGLRFCNLDSRDTYCTSYCMVQKSYCIYCVCCILVPGIATACQGFTEVYCILWELGMIVHISTAIKWMKKATWYFLQVACGKKS